MRPVSKLTIESQQLRVYVVLARLLNMSRAADQLAMTPSGISHCLKTLEDDLGCRLFERTSRNMMLTPAGREFLGDAAGILERMQAVRERIHSWSDWRHGQIRLGANSTACRLLLPSVLREFRESFPDFTVKIEPYETHRANELLSDGRLDMVIGTEPFPTRSMQFELLAEDELQFIVHPLHIWAGKRSVTREQISAGRFIVSEAAGDTFKLIETHFKREQIEIIPHIEVAGEDAVKHFVELDMGVGIVPRWIASKEIEEGRLVSLPLGKRQLKRRWGMFYARSHRLRFAENLLVSICRSVMRDLIPAVRKK
jgi:DNA-binding transcriptional LysR family regulator